MDADDFVKILMALGGVVTGAAGYMLSKRGQHDTREAQAAANALQTRVNTVDELEAVINHLKEERTRAEDERDRLKEQKTLEAEAQAARCQVQIDRLIDNVATLQAIVGDEIQRNVALMSVREAQEHQAEDHGRFWPNGEPGGGVRY